MNLNTPQIKKAYTHPSNYYYYYYYYYYYDNYYILILIGEVYVVSRKIFFNSAWL